ncbi:heme lyase CcmF/NrfE family subunit [soil metagenome]
MRSLLGTAALAGGLTTSASATVWWLLAAGGRRTESRARAMTWGMLACAAAACAVLVWALVVHDFSVRYVAENGARAVPLYYTVISLWAALEGSLLLWLLVLAGYGVLAMRVTHPRAAGLHPWAMAVICAVAVFFFGLAFFAGNAFEVVSPVPPDGPGPNPLLQDHPLMGVHPPLLYLGYVGLTVPFAYAVAGLVTGRTGRGWLFAARRWTLFAWTCLTAGVLLGAWWSYEVLGWGGYWAWDPVENASILPWFTATALLHSFMVQERRATLRVWNLALAASTFLLVVVGTFLTRSGVVASVHSFTQSAIGPALLGFLVAVGVGVGALFVWRADRLGPDEPLDSALSREAMFLGNNVVLVGLAFTVLLGTVFPLAVEALDGQRVSVGAPYFNRMAVPLALALVLLMGVGPLVPWGVADPRALGRRLAVPASVGLVTVGVLGLGGLRGVGPLLTFGLATFVAATILAQFVNGAGLARAATGAGWPRALGIAVARRRRLYGGLVVHAGVVLAAVAIAASSTYGLEGERRLSVGESFAVGDYTARLTAIEPERTPRRMAITAHVALSKDGRPMGVHAPALSFYPAATQAIGTPSVETRASEDAYLVLASVNDERTEATIRLAVNPLVLWLWIAGGVMVAGSLLAGWPARRRQPRPLETTTTVVEGARA